MSHHTNQEPYIPREPGDLITAEDWNEVQQFLRADVEDHAAEAEAAIGLVRDALKEVDAARFGGLTPDEYQGKLDQRYIRRDEPIAVGEYRRYFKQIEEQVKTKGKALDWEPVVIEHKLCRYPLVELFELMGLFAKEPVLKGAGTADSWPFDWQRTKFLVYYASNRDPVAEYLSTEAGERVYWGDPLTLLIDQFNLKPAMTQKLDDVLNDLWGQMFGSQEEDDDFRSESYGHSPYIQKWIDDDKSVNDLISGGQWEDLRMGIRPMLLSAGLAASWEGTENFPSPTPANTIRVYQISQNAIEIRMPRAMDLMVLLRT